MDKPSLNKEFAQRLKESLIKSGFHSTRTNFGVDIHKLVSITGYSEQICRKYLRGEALPEVNKIVEIAKTLSVSPGWLLFGDCKNYTKDEEIIINKDLLLYILTQANQLYNQKNHKFPDFLLEVITDLSTLDVPFGQQQKIVNLALLSLQKFGVVD